MSNAAELLAHFLSQTAANTAAESPMDKRREWGSRLSMNELEVSRYAANLLNEVAQALDDLAAAGRDVEDFADSLDAWTAAVFLPQHNWNAGGPVGDGITKVDLRFLRLLSSAIREAGLEPPIDDGDIDNLRDALGLAAALLADDQLLHDSVRAYIAALLSEAWTVVTGAEFYTGSRIRKITLELSGAMSVVADDIEDLADEGDVDAEEKVSRWRALSRKVATGFVTGASSTAGRQLMEGGVKMIEGMS